MGIVIVMPDGDSEALARAMGERAPEIPVQVWPQVAAPETVRLALAWGPLPDDLFERLPRLEAVVSAGAGVDQLLSRPMPSRIAVGRLVLRSLAVDMSAYCLAAILYRTREFDQYARQQAAGRWQPRPPRRPTVGILGMGQLGRHLAARLRELDFPVLGWRREETDGESGSVFHGAAGLGQVAARSDFLVCLLPLTPETRGVLNRELFCRCRRGAYLINVGRGGHLVDRDLLEALDRGWLSGACLDVFEPEPLPADHPLWSHPRIRITPHVASPTDPVDAAKAVIDDYRRLLRREPLRHQVDRNRGY